MLPYGRQSIAEEDVEAVAEVLRGDWLTTGPAVDAFEARPRRAGRRRAACVSCHVGHGGPAHRLRRRRHRAGRRGGHHPDDVRRDGQPAPRCSARRSSSPTSTPDTGTARPRGGRRGGRPTAPGSSPAVDYAGHPADYAALQPIADRVGALHCSTTPRTRSAARSTAGRSGTLADVTTFSFFPTKNLTTAEGGAVVVHGPASCSSAPASSTTSAWCATRDRLRDPDEGAVAPGGARVRR